MQWNLKIRGKIAVGYLMILFLLGLFLIIVQGRISELEKATEFLSGHDMQVHELTYQIEKDVLDMETGQRGFALTGQESYLDPYYSGLDNWRIHYADLKALISGSISQEESLDSIKANIEDWVAKAGQYVVDLKQSGQEEAVRTYFQADTGKSIIDRIRNESEHFRSIEKVNTEQRIADLKERNRELFIMMYLLWSLVALVAISATILISGGIVRAMKNVVQAIHDIADGHSRSTRLSVNTKDEIKDLVTATNRLLDNAEREQQASERVALMSLKLQEKTDIYSLCDTFLFKLAEMLEIQYGAVYLAQENSDWLVKISTYAGGEPLDEMGRNRIKRGDGLVGQCAQDQKLLKLEEVPENYITIHSGLGRIPPRYAVIAPVVFENRTVAVLEIASLMKWLPEDMSLLKKLLDIFAVTVNSVTTRAKIQQLYHEAQIMNEELQSQSEELLTQTHELINVNGKLETQMKIAENTAGELEKMNAELQRSSRYKSEFLANMSHELRTPLNSILLLSQLLSENTGGTLSDEQQSFASVINTSGADLLAIINDILDLSKVEAGKMLIEISAVNLTDFPAVFQGYFGKTAEAKNLDFSVILQEGVPDLFYTDELRLHQILRNLLSNAFKFTDTGSVTLEVSRQDNIEFADYAPEGPVLAFAVRDTGIGVPLEKSRLIFEAFRQADGSTARKYGGTGLGLSISLQLSKLLGGHLALESGTEQGSVFTLYLPLHEEPWDPEELPESPASESVRNREPKNQETADREATDEWSEEEPDGDPSGVLAGATVLIVDDDERNLFALSQRLESYRMNVITAQSGFECLEKVRTCSHIDIILLDIMMPVLDGYDTLSILRDEMQLNELPVITVSAKTMKEERQRCLAAGATDFIAKPVNIKELIGLLRRYLYNKAA